MARQTFKTTPRGRTLMKYLDKEPLIFLKREMQETTPEEAAEIWTHIKPYMPIIASRTGMSKNGMQHGHLLRKMQLVEARAKEATAT